MSALPKSDGTEARSLRAMSVRDLDEVVRIEASAYEFPWTRGNFIDSMHAGYDLSVLDSPAGVLGYFVAMSGVDELHLLNLTVAQAVQGRGHARHMLDALCLRAQAKHARQLWLEVRLSNIRARALYERYGFRGVGMRRAYYPATGGMREDALVMSLNLPEAAE